MYNGFEAKYAVHKLTLLSIRAAATEHGIPYWLLSEAVRSGRIKSVTLSKRRLIPAEALKAFIEEANSPHCTHSRTAGEMPELEGV